MSTWHQDRAGNNRPPPGKPDRWTVWTNPPNRMASSMTGFASREDAQAYIDRCNGYRPGEADHSYIIPPKDD